LFSLASERRDFLLYELYFRSVSARFHRAAPGADPTIPYDIAAFPSQ
jgi:hypothetical protein